MRLSRICQNDSNNVSDMSEVSPINTKDLLTNIKNRYDENEIFTNVWETLIITNPYQIIPGLYTEDKMKEIIEFCKENSVEKYERGQPHCFDITMYSIFNLLNQSRIKLWLSQENLVLVKQNVHYYVWNSSPFISEKKKKMEKKKKI